MNFFIQILCLWTLLSLTTHSLAQVTLRKIASTPEMSQIMSGGDPELQRNLILGNIIKSGLENLHFSKKQVDDKLSAIAFEEYLKALDFGKRFLTTQDIASLQKYQTKIDDQVVSGQLSLLQDAEKALQQRIKQVRDYVKGRLKQSFNLETKQTFEFDPEKRNWVKNTKELFSLWNNILAVDLINNRLDLEEEGDESLQSKKKKRTARGNPKKAPPREESGSDKKPAKKLSAEEMAKESLVRTEKRYLRVFERMLQEDHNNRLSKFFNAIAKIYDPHTQYLPPREKEDFNISMSGSLEGIGAILREDGNYIKVVEIIPGSASWRGKKLKAEDTILKVAQGTKEPIDIVGMRVEDAVQLIRGKKGSEVRLTVKHGDGRSEIISIVRDVVVIEESYVKYSTIEQKGNGQKFGYIQVPTFYRDFKKRITDKTARNCTNDVARAVEGLKKLKVAGIVLDLRNNGGGSLEDARLMSGLFVKKGPIVQVKNYEGRIEVLQDKDPKILYGGPLAILTNKFSASASEILASAMQDYGRAVIIGGADTHGKGTVQTLLDLDQYISPRGPKLNSSLGSIKLTIQKFYRVTGGSTQFKGITPDIILPDPLGYLEGGEKYHDYPLPWDEVKALKFEHWPHQLSLSELQKRSRKRVNKHQKFQNIVKSVKLLEKKRGDTKVAVSLKTLRDRRVQSRADSERFEYDEVNPNIVVSNISLDSKLLSDDQKERKDDWVEGLKRDPYIEETLQILSDLRSLANPKAAKKS